MADENSTDDKIVLGKHASRLVTATASFLVVSLLTAGPGLWFAVKELTSDVERADREREVMQHQLREQERELTKLAERARIRDAQHHSGSR